MSWSVGIVGKASAVLEKIPGDFAQTKCAEPEETIKSMAADMVAKALASFAPNMAVRVNASGSQYAIDGVVKYNSLNIQIEPLYGFVE